MTTGAYPCQWKTVHDQFVFRDRGGGPDRSPQGAPKIRKIRENAECGQNTSKFTKCCLNRGFFYISGWG